MSEIDFKHLGIVANDALLDRITSALTEIRALGDLELHAAWLYFGGLKQAAEAFGVSQLTFRQAIQREVRLKYDTLSERAREDLWLGAELILEMPDNMRALVCSKHTIRSNQFVLRIQRACEVNALRIVDPCVRLLDSYVRLWKYRRNPRILFQASGFTRPTQLLLTRKELLDKRGSDSKACSVALEIIKEYETYLWHRQAIERHKVVQRQIQSRNHAKFVEALVLRDGKQCQGKDCKAKRNLLIDHRKPIVLGGFTEMSNLQLLCFSCNSKKGAKFEGE